MNTHTPRPTKSKRLSSFGVHLSPSWRAWVRKQAAREFRTNTAIVERALLAYREQVKGSAT